MAHYKARIHGRQGTQVIEVDAVDAQDAERKASRQGQVLSVKKTFSIQIGGLSFPERQIMMTRLSQMLASKLGEGESLKLMRNTFSGGIKRVAHQLLIKVESGADLPRAIEEVGQPHFPPNVVAMIAAGSKSGDTWRALRDAAEFEREMIAIRKGGNATMIKSIAVMLLSMVAIVGTVFYGYPKVMDNPMMRAYSSSVNVDWAVDLSYAISYLIIGVLALMAALGLLSTVGRVLFPRGADAVILRIPYFKDLVLARYNYIAFYGLSMLIGTGVRLRDAILLTAGTMRKGALRADMEKAADAIAAGREWSNSLRSLHPTDRAALSSSMDKAQIANSLSNIGVQYKELYRIRVEALGPMLQSVAMLSMTIAGVIIFALIILPMMQVMEGML
ncbi:general secretion pathway protein F [Natronocella acetinitrilica]|uniref:General secretion pathway protein F n=1 Tax=Natronocella acetinitrilica TaxID=414046 RepID=A0AAE3G1Q9_9GAMM|nr:type II secretion system F family protein [Natronocella acetinitrilica]MCP1674215.1 general secretion pathway protein F [Natronocella acetinitrilica]